MIMPHWSQARSPSSETGVIDALSSPRQPAAAASETRADPGQQASTRHRQWFGFGHQRIFEDDRLRPSGPIQTPVRGTNQIR